MPKKQKRDQVIENITHYMRHGLKDIKQVRNRFGLIRDSAGRVYTADPAGRRLIGYVEN